jgi:nucleotide-binding universal stress UspA family protein
MLRKILLPLSGSPHDAAALRAAFDLARSFGAHVEGLFVRIDPRDAVPLLGEGMSGAIVDDIVRTAEAESMRASRAAGAAFEAARMAAGVPGVERLPGPGAPSARWMERVGRPDELVAREARLADLTVFAQPAVTTDVDSTLVLETALLASGRPLLLVPDAPFAAVGSAVAIAWNGSAEASAAVFAAMPFLARAAAVHVLTVGTDGTGETGALAGEGLVEYLACHGIAAHARRLHPGAEPVGAGLAAAAAESGAGLLVMGGYGHSRVREMILGGVTRYVIGRAGIPVLMAH